MSISSSAFIFVYSLSVAFFIGLVMGSFLNCVAYRIAHGQKFWKGRSKCPACGHTLGAFELIPLVSWLFLRGRCKSCGVRIPARYPLTELVFGIASVLTLLRFDLSFICLRNYIFFCCLFCLSLVDLEKQEIPNGLLIASVVAWVAFVPLMEQPLETLKNGLIAGAAFGVGMLLIVLLMDKIMKKDTMGGGDIKLFAVVGLYCGVFGSIFTLILACVFGLLFAFIRRLMSKRAIDVNESKTEVKTEQGTGSISVKQTEEIENESNRLEESADEKGEKGQPFPFGPSIALATFLILLYGQPLINWYQSLFS